MTPHNRANKEDVASIVLLPGCPLRAKWIAENFLENSKLINDVRNMYAYTGTYKGKKITVMGSGMGIPSAGIYTWELFDKNIYDVDLIIRIGSCGAYSEKINVGDILLAQSSYSKTYYAEQVGVMPENNTIHVNEELLSFAKSVADQQQIPVKLCKVHCSDAFYEKDPLEVVIKRTNTEVVDMESFVLFLNAQIHKKQALTLLTCSDCLWDKKCKSLCPSEREKNLGQMIKASLEMSLQYKKN